MEVLTIFHQLMELHKSVKIMKIMKNCALNVELIVEKINFIESFIEGVRESKNKIEIIYWPFPFGSITLESDFSLDSSSIDFLFHFILSFSLHTHTQIDSSFCDIKEPFVNNQ
jgi:hypothetical protein